MLHKVKLKQGTLAWEKARGTRVGSSEVFDIVKYYATDEELQNCSINAEAFRKEKPYTTVWALYHKMKNDGIYQKGVLPPEFAEYGHAIEPYGLRVLREQREKKPKVGSVYLSDRLIASLDIDGVAEEIDCAKPFDFGHGYPKVGQRFVCEQKSMMPGVMKRGVPYKYIIQAQYQIMETAADFFILQIMMLKEDTVFERGKICQMAQRKRTQYLDDKMTVTHLYFRNNEHLAMLIKTCLERFFDDVDNWREPRPFLEYDSQQNIIESICLNVLYDKDRVLDYKLGDYIKAKEIEDQAIANRKKELQKIVDIAKEYHACGFQSEDGITGAFTSNGSFRLRFPKERGDLE